MYTICNVIIICNIGHTKRITNNDLVNYLMQPSPKQQLTTMGVENVFPYAGFTEENLRDYYEHPPAGLFSYFSYKFLVIIFYLSYRY